MHGGTVHVTSEGKDWERVRRAAASGRRPERPVITTVTAFAPRPAPLDPTRCTVANALAGRRIPVVEDNADAAELLAEWFRGKGADVRTALDGDSALRQRQRDRPELGVIDIGLPGIDGTARAAAAAGSRAQAPAAGRSDGVLTRLDGRVGGVWLRRALVKRWI